MSTETIEFVNEHGDLVEHTYSLIEREICGPDGVEQVITDAHLLSCRYLGSAEDKIR